jgi:hypothetical protein
MNFKHSFLFTGSLLLTFWLLISFSPKPKIVTSDLAVPSVLFYTVLDYPSQLKTSQHNTEIPFLDNSYVAFKEALAFKESQGKYGAVNTLGYLGKYQFGVSTLELLGIKNPRVFLNSPALQEKAFLVNTKRNKWVLRRDIKRFVGKKINGILITESGILAAAHLAGPGNIKRYLRSYGAIGTKDAYGTDISSYMRKFSNYNTSFVTAQKKPDLALP